MALAGNVNSGEAIQLEASSLVGPSAVLPSRVPTNQALRQAEPVRDGDIVVLVGEGDIPIMMVNALASTFGPIIVVREKKQPTGSMVKRRLRMLGPVQAAGQVAFGVILKLLHKRAAARKSAIAVEGGLDTSVPASVTLHDVQTVNSDSCRAIIQTANPRVVVLIGTRMVRKPTLECTDAPFINYHAGLNPTYRGMNGAYWALASDDPAGAGVTVHLVDEGVDTGKELYWRRFKPTKADNFVTYPLQQAVVGRDLLVGAVRDALDGTLAPQDVSLKSAQWFHPTVWGYLWTGATKGVW